jgi:hypothetical protein
MAAANLNKDTARIGFIGLGLRGSRLARRQRMSKWNLEVCNRSRERERAVSQNGIPIALQLPRSLPPHSSRTKARSNPWDAYMPCQTVRMNWSDDLPLAQGSFEL